MNFDMNINLQYILVAIIICCVIGGVVVYAIKCFKEYMNNKLHINLYIKSLTDEQKQDLHNSIENAIIEREFDEFVKSVLNDVENKLKKHSDKIDLEVGKYLNENEKRFKNIEKCLESVLYEKDAVKILNKALYEVYKHYRRDNFKDNFVFDSWNMDNICGLTRNLGGLK